MQVLNVTLFSKTSLGETRTSTRNRVLFSPEPPLFSSNDYGFSPLIPPDCLLNLNFYIFLKEMFNKFRGVSLSGLSCQAFLQNSLTGCGQETLLIRRESSVQARLKLRFESVASLLIREEGFILRCLHLGSLIYCKSYCAANLIDLKPEKNVRV